MVNLVAAQRPLLHALMKLAGVKPVSVDIAPGTVMRFWVPTRAPHAPPNPAVVLIHGFAAEGIVTWQFQVGALSRHYDVYVPDLMFFGESATSNAERSPEFQAECLAAGLRKLGVGKCVVVGFSYGGMVGFKMGQIFPEMVVGMVISGSILAMTDSISGETLKKLGFDSSSELLLPTSVKGLKALLSVAAYKKLWFPNRLHKDFLEVMFNNRKDRAELLEGLIINNMDSNKLPTFTQRIHLLWGEHDQIFNVELAHKLKEELGENATFESIPKAGHLVHLERPCVYNRCLKNFLHSLHSNSQTK